VRERVTGTADDIKERGETAIRSAAEARDEALASLDDVDEPDQSAVPGSDEAPAGTASEVRAATIGEAGPAAVDIPAGEGEPSGGVAPAGKSGPSES
jgi:hypothetical protein